MRQITSIVFRVNKYFNADNIILKCGLFWYNSHNRKVTEMEIGKKYGAEITIHMDPIDTKNPEIPLIKDKINETLKSLNNRITFHDLRLVAGPTHTNILFDIVIPSGIKIEKSTIISALQISINSIDKKYILVIKIDSSYTNY